MGNLSSSISMSNAEKKQVMNMNVTVRHLLDQWKAGKFSKIVVMCGAGISVSAGIPDFRSPGTGLYDNLEQYNLPSPESVFTLNYFRRNPYPFYRLSKEIMPGAFSPTPTHAFIRLLQDKGVLRRCYTQNIDTLERMAGIEAEKLVEAHGSYSACHCVHCGKEYSQAWFTEKINSDAFPYCESCTRPAADQEVSLPEEEGLEERRGYVKPDIVFFGEDLPSRFAQLMEEDLQDNCDLLLIMGTSLQVAPFCNLASMVSPQVPRLLINMELVGQGFGSFLSPNMLFHEEDNYRDMALLGPSDESIEKLCAYLGWGEEFRQMVNEVCFAQGSSGVSSDHWLKGITFTEERDEQLDFDWRRQEGNDDEEEDDDNEEEENDNEEGDENEELETQTSIPRIEDLHKYKGEKEGQLSLFKDRMGEAFVYKWYEEEDTWKPLCGSNKVTKSKKKTLFKGQLVDMVLPVIIESASRGVLEFEMGLNHSDDPEEAASSFCKEHDLNEAEYKGQIVDFLMMLKQS